MKQEFRSARHACRYKFIAPLPLQHHFREIGPNLWWELNPDQAVMQRF
jgi:hypothetical protein